MVAAAAVMDITPRRMVRILLALLPSGNRPLDRPLPQRLLPPFLPYLHASTSTRQSTWKRIDSAAAAPPPLHPVFVVAAAPGINAASQASGSSFTSASSHYSSGGGGNNKPISTTSSFLVTTAASGGGGSAMHHHSPMFHPHPHQQQTLQHQMRWFI